MASSVSVDDQGVDNAKQPGLNPSDHTSNDLDNINIPEAATTGIDSTQNATDLETDGSPQKTAPTLSSSTSSSSLSSSSPPASPGMSPESQYSTLLSHQQGGGKMHFPSTLQTDLPPPPIRRSLSFSKRQSMFLGDHITISHDGPIIESPSSGSPDSNDDQEDMKEVQIETTNPSHLFWVPFHLHPEIAPNEYNRWLSKHGTTSPAADGIVSSRRSSVSRRKSVLSALYNPEDDLDDQPGASGPAKITEETGIHDFLSGVFSMPLEQMGEPPLKTKTSLRRSVSLSVSSPTRGEFPADAIEEELVTVKRSGLERGGLSLLRRSARTKLRRNSSASNDTRPDMSRLRQTMNADGEYPAVSLVDLGPQPLPSAAPSPETTENTTEDPSKARKDGEAVPVKRFVSTLRDSSKPTITTYVEPHLLEQQRRDYEEATKDDEGASPSFRISAPGKLENSAAAAADAENFAVSYPKPPPVKLTQNLLQQQPAAQQQQQQPLLSQTPQSPPKQKQPGQTGPSHSKKPSTWSWLWGKEKGGEKLVDPSAAGSNVITPSSTSSSSKPNNLPSPQPTSPETNTQTSSTEATVKKQSTLSMLFSRNGKSTSSKGATSADTTRSSTSNGYNGQVMAHEKPKYSNYNRFPIHIERAIYRLSHVKLANPRRPLHEQVLISNMMFWYLGVIQQQQQQHQQQQAEMQRQQQEAQLQKEGNKGSDKEDSKESKSKKPKKRKSQKKKNPQRSPSNSVENVTKGPEYDKQQRNVGHGARPRQQGASLPSGNPSMEKEGRRTMNRQLDSDLSDSQDESEVDEALSEQHQQQKPKSESQSDTLTLSFNSDIGASQDGEEDDDARGPKKHLKRLNAPKHWMLDKLTGTYAPRPSTGPHKLRECLPLIILMRNRLKYALNGKEVQSILMQRLVQVDGKVRTDTTFPAGFMDVITIEKTGENFRLVYDTKGRFTIHRITADEAKYKLCKVKKVQLGSKGIPFIVTHDGRTLRYPDPLIKVNDTIKLDLETGKFNEFIKFERHIGGFDIVHIKDVLDRQFATRLTNVFVIGEGNKPWVSLPKNKGVKLTIAEERDRRRAAAN
ncbi:40S ribosomal protein S4 [Modicella reniformis]|uniref:40S ribosomal protein S4 n=1 Tax=Modicella reniformis TaxID=1440133 RepID=A0A9P6MAZ4_9FUNG|nr:40S ribosomal protein S4 [Modicella reniformis]